MGDNLLTVIALTL